MGPGGCGAFRRLSCTNSTPRDSTASPACLSLSLPTSVKMAAEAAAAPAATEAPAPAPEKRQFVHVRGARKSNRGWKAVQTKCVGWGCGAGNGNSAHETPLSISAPTAPQEELPPHPPRLLGGCQGARHCIQNAGRPQARSSQPESRPGSGAHSAARGKAGACALGHARGGRGRRGTARGCNVAGGAGAPGGAQAAAGGERPQERQVPSGACSAGADTGRPGRPRRPSQLADPTKIKGMSKKQLRQIKRTRVTDRGVVEFVSPYAK